MRLTLHVDGPVSRRSGQRCLFRLRAAIREGGTQRTCLESIDGFPAPSATMHSRGVMMLSLPGGTIVLRVRIRQRFAADGAHARQTVTGVVVGGRGRFEGARGSITGGGTVIDTRESLRRPRLVYTVTFTRGY